MNRLLFRKQFKALEEFSQNWKLNFLNLVKFMSTLKSWKMPTTRCTVPSVMAILNVVFQWVSRRTNL